MCLNEPAVETSREINMRMYDAAVVGSGPNGLAAAIVLASAGRSVIVFEANSSIGGGARTEELTLPGFLHDVCSAIHPMGIGSPFFRTLPLEQHGLHWIQPPLPLAHPLDSEPPCLLHRSVEKTAQGLGDDRSPYLALMKPFADAWDSLAADALGPLAVPKSPWLLARLGLVALRSANGLARAKFRGSRAPALLAGICAHSTLPLEQAPSAAIGLMLAIAGHAVGWPLPRGGSRHIANALASQLRSLGGEIETERRIRTLGEIPTQGAILFDTSPSTLCQVVADQFSPSFRRRLMRYRYGPGVFKVDWALDGPVPWRDPDCQKAATMHLGGSLEEISAGERAVAEGRHPERPFVLLAQPSLFDPTRAPAGKHTAWAYCHVPAFSTKDMTSEIERQVERFAPGFRQRILGRHTLNARQIEERNANYVGGDINCGTPSLSQLFFRPTARIVPYATPNPRIFLCSSATPPGGGVHGMCGFHAATAALRRWKRPI